jgi:Bacterial SH3 domain
MGILLLCLGILLLLLGSLIILSSRVVGSSFNPSINFRNNRKKVPLGPIFLTSGSLLLFLGLAPIWNRPLNNFQLFSGNSVSQIENSAQNNTAENSTSIYPAYQVKCTPEADGLNLRKNPKLNATVITVIPCNANNIEKIGESQQKDGEVWLPVKYSGSTGWSVAKYLEKTRDPGN